MQTEQRAKLMWHNGELPDREGTYLITIADGHNRRIKTARYYLDRGFLCHGKQVLAWAELPAAFQGKICDTRPHWQWDKETDYKLYGGSQEQKGNNT